MSACTYKGALSEGSAQDVGTCLTEGRWKLPDRSGAFCSMHFVLVYGHGEKLVRADSYEIPAVKVKPPAPKRGVPA